MVEKEKIACPKCNKLMESSAFFTHRNGQKSELCKKCLTLHVDNFNPDTYTWILKTLDFPYVPQIWNEIRDRQFAKDPLKMNGLSVLGRYLSKMHLQQLKDKGWADSEELQKQYNTKNAEEEDAATTRAARLKEMFEAGEISEAEYRTLVPTEIQHQAYEKMRQAELSNSSPPPPPPEITVAANPFANEDKFMPEEELIDPSKELTKDDKLYLAMKWGRLYTPNDWISLERHYTEMTKGFDIQDPDTINTLILISKTYLKLNQAIDAGDLDAVSKLTRVYDTMRKSVKLTALQNKKEEKEVGDSISELVAFCELNKGRIPQFEIKAPQDVIDLEIQDMKDFTKNLVEGDPSLTQQIEAYIAQKRINDEKITAEMCGEEPVVEELTDDDFQDFFDKVERQREQQEESEE